MSKLLGRQWVRDLLLGLGLLAAIGGLVFFPQASMEAARDGLALCCNVIVPSLFPFFVLSSLVVDLGLANYMGRALEPLMRPLFRVGGVCASAFALGFLGGYPVGARTAIQLYEKNLCTKTEAERLLAFCNNSGPAFILGVVGTGIFGSSRVGLLLYLAHAVSSLCVGVLFRFYKGGDPPTRSNRATPEFRAQRFSVSFTNCVKNGLSATLNICAFVLFFTVVIRLLSLTGILPALAELLGVLLAPLGFSAEWGRRLLTGVVELTSGVGSLSGVGQLPGRLSMAAFMLGWAGISVHCQVLSFLGGSGLSCRTYVVGKFLHGAFSALFVGAIGRLVPLEEPVGAYLTEQVAGIAGLDFYSALTASTVAAWLGFLFFFLLAFSCRKRRTHVI